MVELDTVILATDASFDFKHHLSAYAFYIQIPRKEPWKQAGVAKRMARSSTEAELIALANALHCLKQCRKPVFFKLMVYIDNKAALLHADPNYVMKSKDARKFQRNNEDIVSYCRQALSQYDFELHHIKAHTSALKVSWGHEHHMNHWCDKASRDEMRKARALLKPPKETTMEP